MAARLAAQTRCHNVVVLDLAGLSPIADYFVLASGTSARQMRSVCDEIHDLAASSRFATFSRSGYEGETWMVIDFVDVVVHLFNPESRAYYDLDNLWGDARPVAWDDLPAKSG